MTGLIHITKQKNEPAENGLIVVDPHVVEAEGSAAEFDEQGPFVRDFWPDAPCDEQARVPRGWTLDEGGGRNGKARFDGRLIVTRILKDADNGRLSVVVSFKMRGTWRELECPRRQISSTAAIVGLSDQGLEVSSDTGGTLVKFLSAYQRANENCIPLVALGRRTGWYPKHGFLCGHEQIATTGQLPIQFRGEWPEADRLVTAIRRNGTLHGWCRAIGRLREHPRALIAVYASLATPLLWFVPASNWILSYEGPTSTGKTNCQHSAGSVWGNPLPEGLIPSIVFSWNATPVFLERLASIYNNLPLTLDDTSNLSKSNETAVKDFIYQFTSGSSRGRGNTNGVDTRRNWRSLLISSGEVPLTSFSQFGGTRARVLTISGAPFPTSQASARLLERLRADLRNHHGHAGPRIVSFIQSQIHPEDEWQSQFQECRTRYEQRAGEDPVRLRMSDCLAHLELGARIAHQALPFDWEYEDIVDDLYPELTASAEDADRGTAALEDVHTWADHQRERFEHEGRNSSSTTHGIWRWTGRNNSDPCLVVYPFKLDGRLKAAGFNAEEIRRNWKNRDWLRTELNKTTVRVSTSNGEHRCPMVAIRWSAINQLMDEGDEADPTA